MGKILLWGNKVTRLINVMEDRVVPSTSPPALPGPLEGHSG